MKNARFFLPSIALFAFFSLCRLEAAETVISVERAEEIALAASGGGKVVLFRSEVDGSRLEYEITVLKDDICHEVEVDAASGRVKEHERRPVYRASSSVREPAFSRHQAEEKALEMSGGGDIISFELEVDGKNLRYEIDVANNGAKHEIELDANSGVVITHSVETPAR